ncbi:hypothetical protein ADK70_12475 [Streptomyces rimosus subsp. pseudoverticillatus]|uniref:hypothetical protein n=1 Tax=Streptomyces rimosus TaxID=1927 RepID=UPI0006B26BE9|nr:hypothetical protein [Streptomyces rimosus]KOT94488.1 hypothetical protein ADK70_12475 [Streptomyces rimosus subsp. pseudoverticillatus]
MGLIANLIDNFNDGVIGPEWGNYYGGVSETGGRARVPCTTGFAGYQSAYQWTLAGSSVYVQVPTRPAASGATEAYCAFMVNSGVDGTRIGFTINVVTTMLRMQSDVGYFDATAVEIAYSGTTHLWLRIRETGGNVLWDTSPDGSTWTNRRTLATPSWVTTGIDTCALDLSAHRSSGTTDFAEYDRVNTLSNAALFTGTCTGTAASGATVTSKRIARATTTGSAQANGAATVRQTAYAAAHGSAQTTGVASPDAVDLSDIAIAVGPPRRGYYVGAPWR